LSPIGLWVQVKTTAFELAESRTWVLATDHSEGAQSAFALLLRMVQKVTARFVTHDYDDNDNKSVWATRTVGALFRSVIRIRINSECENVCYSWGKKMTLGWVVDGHKPPRLAAGGKHLDAVVLHL
jgi:hypothetical protein